MSRENTTDFLHCSNIKNFELTKITPRQRFFQLSLELPSNSVKVGHKRTGSFHIVLLLCVTHEDLRAHLLSVWPSYTHRKSIAFQSVLAASKTQRFCEHSMEKFQSHPVKCATVIHVAKGLSNIPAHGFFSGTFSGKFNKMMQSKSLSQTVVCWALDPSYHGYIPKCFQSGRHVVGLLCWLVECTMIGVWFHCGTSMDFASFHCSWYLLLSMSSLFQVCAPKVTKGQNLPVFYSATLL